MAERSGAETSVTIDHVGHRGDGVTTIDGRTRYIPFTLAGERVRVRLDGDRAEAVEIVDASPDRQPPICRHFGTCGGCGLQHMRQHAYLAWKRGQVVAALSARGIEVPVAEVLGIDGGSRRRTILAAVRASGGVVLGYHARKSHRLVDITECPVLIPDIADAFDRLRRIAEGACPRRGQMTLTVLATDAGLDVCLTGTAKPSAALRHNLIERALQADLARLAIDDEVLVETRPPAIAMGSVAAIPPPGAFVQASRKAEVAMAEAVLAATASAKTVADLFCGVGTFTLRLAHHAAVTGVEADPAAVTALENAVRRSPGLKPVTVARRDLFRRPLMPAELDRFDAVVFDPPRAGAKSQAEMLAACKVPTLVAVSCNPATFARDMRILMDGGYVPQSVQPVDQFLYSSHIEVVAELRRR